MQQNTDIDPGVGNVETAALPKRLGWASRRGGYAAIAFAVFLMCYVLARFPAYFDAPLERSINRLANRSPALDRLFYDLDTYFTFSGVVLFSLLWWCWFAERRIEARSRLLAGVLASISGGIAGRFLQHTLSSHPRPFYDPQLSFNVPSVLGNTPFNTWDSFPSDHATVFIGLATVLCLARPGLGFCTAVWIVIVEFSRAYLGAHYPSDLIGGAALGCGLVLLANTDPALALCRPIVARERASPAAFYLCGFFVSYQIATLFQDIRSAAGGVALLHEVGSKLFN